MMPRYWSFLFCLFALFVTSACDKGKDVYIRCDELQETRIVLYPEHPESLWQTWFQGGWYRGDRYFVVFEARDEHIRSICNAIHENNLKNASFTIYVNDKLAGHYTANKDFSFPPTLIYSPFVLSVEGGKTYEEALAKAKSFCPSTLPEGRVPVITHYEKIMLQNNWVREERKKADAARLRALQAPQ